MSERTVTLGMPAYRGEAFIVEALESILGQTHRDFLVLISLDGPDAALLELCRPFLRDARIRLQVQPKRRGWVGNINWLMRQADTTYWCYQQQDDLIDPTYLEVLIDAAERAPEAAVVFADIVAFGTLEKVIKQATVAGSPTGRQLSLLYDHHSAVAFRGLTRVTALRRSGKIRSNSADDFSADTVWMSSMARSGELHRIPAALYRKRYHDANEHAKWRQWPDEQRERAWAVHCTHMIEEAMTVAQAADERRLLWAAALHRLTTARPAPVYLPDSSRTDAGRAALMERFRRILERRGTLDLTGLTT